MVDSTTPERYGIACTAEKVLQSQKGLHCSDQYRSYNHLDAPQVSLTFGYLLIAFSFFA